MSPKKSFSSLFKGKKSSANEPALQPNAEAASGAGAGVDADAPAPAYAPPPVAELGAPQKLRAINCNVFAIPKLYTPIDNSLTPSELFPDGKTAAPKHCTIGNCSNGQVVNHQYDRFVCTADPHAVLIYAAGSVIDKDKRGKMLPFGGYGHVYHGPRNAGNRASQVPEQRFIAMPMELSGPDNVEHENTPKRAELRAALAVLQIHDWDANNIQRLVIATSSEYVVRNATQSLGRALINDFRCGSDGRDMELKDLWVAFWKECDYWHKHGLEVFFWQITEEQNEDARKHAEAGAAKPNASAFMPLRSLMV